MTSRKVLGILAVMVLGASMGFAQSSTSPSDPNQTRATQNDEGTPRDHSNWGWLGLLGLGGLAGLRRGGREINQSDRNVSETRRAA
jgi:MYXO-CTERM domain-containing protein